MAKRARYNTPFETDQLRKSLSEFFETPYDDPMTGQQRPIGSYKWGVYIFYDYDGEPIYVGQTKERISGRISRHLTNQRTDAVAMSVLDPFEVYEIEVYPLSQFENINSKHPEYKHAKAYLDSLEHWVHEKAIQNSRYNAILNEKDPPEPTLQINAPLPLRGCIVSEEVYKLRSHSDIRIARRAQIIARLSQTISERQVQNGLRRTLVTQAERLRRLADERFRELGGQATVQKGAEGEGEENGT
jgi:uridine kinase